MDPISVLGGVASAVQLAQIALGPVVEYFKAVKDARSDILSLTASLSALQSVIEDMQARNPPMTALQTLNKPMNPNDEPKDQITPLQALEKEMKRLRVKLHTSRSGGNGGLFSARANVSTKQRLLWPFKSGEVSQTIRAIEHYKSLFAVALSADSAESAVEIKSLVSDIQARTRELEAAQSAATQALQANDDRLRVTQKTVNETHAAVALSQKILYATHSAAAVTYGTLQEQLELQMQWIEYDKFEKAVNLRERVLEWLCPEPHDMRHRDIKRQREKDTGDWLIETDEFKAWESGTESQRILWGHGIPGAGKTFLSSRVIDHLVQNDEYSVAYIYFDYTQISNHDISSVLGSLIAQFVSQQAYLNPALVQQYDKFMSKREKPTEDDLFTILLNVCQVLAPSRVFIVCDALDECSIDNRRKLLPRLQSMAENGLSLFLTSRPHPTDVNNALRDVPKVDLEARGVDTRIYIVSKIRDDNDAQELISRAMRSQKPVPEEPPEEWIADKLVAVSKGMFLLVRFLVEFIQHCTTPRQILNELAKLEGEYASADAADWLDLTYRRAVETIKHLPPARRRIAIRVISWLTHEHPPRHWKWQSYDVTSERIIRTAVSIEPGMRELTELDLASSSSLVDACAGLVVLDEASSSLRLAHYTVSEYFHRHPLVSRRQAHTELANSCATFLSLDIFNTAEEVASEEAKAESVIDTFYAHAARGLGFYMESTDEEEVQETIMDFLGRRQSLIKFIKEVTDVEPEDKHDTLCLALHTAAFIGASAATKELLAKGADKTEEPLDNVTPLFLASEQGHEDIVRILLEHGVEPNSHGTNPLLPAARGGHEKVALLLMDHGVSLTATDPQGNTPLLLAIWSENETIVRRILELGADVSQANHHGTTPLLRASYSGNEKLARLFLERGAMVGETDSDGDASLSEACRGGYYHVARLLLDYGAEINAANNDGVNSLMLAVDGGFESIVELLLMRGAQVNGADNNNVHCAIRCAAGDGHEEIVRLLLECGARVNVPNNKGATPLLLAADRGHEAVCRLLLAYGADPMFLDEDQDMPIHCAARQGHVGVVRLLLEHGSPASPANEDGNTPLLGAARNGNEDMTRFLVESGASVNEMNKNGMTPLNYAVDSGNVNLVRFLLEQGADPSITDNERHHVPICCAVGEKQHEIAKLLIEYKADVNIANSSGFTALALASDRGIVETVRILLENGANVAPAQIDAEALHHAARSGHTEVARVLLDHGCPVDWVDSDGDTPLLEAARGGYEELSRLLVERGANPNARANNGFTPLLRATDKASVELVRILLEAGADVEAVDESDEHHPLRCAVSEGREEVVKLILEKGVDVNKRNGKGFSPLMMAIDRNHENIARMLLEKGAEIMVMDEKKEHAPLICAASEGHENIVRMLLERGAETTIQTVKGATPLMLAAGHAHYSIVRLLLDNNAAIDTVDEDGDQASHWAARTGREQALRILFEKGADLNAKNNTSATCLGLAANGGHLDAVRFLLDNGAQVEGADSEGDPGLIGAAARGEDAIVRLLIDRGANVNAVTGKGASSLLLAADRGHEGIVRMLLDNGADPHIADNDKDLPIHCSSRGGYTSVVRLLLDRGSNPSAANLKGNTPLHSATRRGHLDIVKMLVERGADLMALDEDDDSVLHEAARGGDVDTVQFLLDRGLNFCAVNKKGETPEELAIKFTKEEAAKIIREWPATFPLPDSPTISRSSSVESLEELCRTEGNHYPEYSKKIVQQPPKESLVWHVHRQWPWSWFIISWNIASGA